ncbi:MAG TPA: HDOD domain-containing protein [Anaerolineaceae bacterium]|nr:HDOD domain-containing protein [Anaerolineaceae bacterium]
MPPLPQVAQKAMFMIRDPEMNMTELARVISMDQVMTGLILRWANSAYFGLLVPITTMQQAIMYLGQNTIQSLILTASISSYFDRPIPGYGLDRGDLWKHSVCVAASARIIANRFGKVEAEEAYHAGLLCDIGKLVFDQALRNFNPSTKEFESISFDELEKTYFGIDHATLGAIVAQNWSLPPLLIDAINYHHHPGASKDFIKITSAVHLADVFVTMLGVGIGKDGLMYRIDPMAVATLHFNEHEVDELIARVALVIEETEVLISNVSSKRN